MHSYIQASAHLWQYAHPYLLVYIHTHRAREREFQLSIGSIRLLPLSFCLLGLVSWKELACHLSFMVPKFALEVSHPWLYEMGKIWTAVWRQLRGYWRGPRRDLPWPGDGWESGRKQVDLKHSETSTGNTIIYQANVVDIFPLIFHTFCIYMHILHY